MVGHLLTMLIRVYQAIVAPMLGPACRFEPTCSQYSIEAIGRHGPMRGFLLTLQRLSRCHPFRVGGFDPVP